MKHSKLQRKFVNQMRSMAEVPWPARRFKYPPTFARLSTQHQLVLNDRCTRAVGETKVRKGRLKLKRTVPVLCGGKQIVKLGNGKRRVYCEDCRARERQRKKELRMRRQLEQRFGIPMHLGASEKSGATKRMLSKFRRSGVR